MTSSMPRQNHGVATNFLQSPPLSDPELLFEDVFSNDYVHQIVRSYLGPDIQMSFITANTALANSKVRRIARRRRAARLQALTNGWGLRRTANLSTRMLPGPIHFAPTC